MFPNTHSPMPYASCAGYAPPVEVSKDTTTPRKFVLPGRSPWDSETGDPSHSFTYESNAMPIYNNTPTHTNSYASNINVAKTLSVKDPRLDMSIQNREMQALSSDTNGVENKVLRQTKLIEYD